MTTTVNEKELSATDVFKAYVSALHAMLLAAMLIIFGLGASILYQTHLGQKNVELIAQLLAEKEELALENIRLQEIATPIQERIKRGANYIHQKHKVDMKVALEYSHKEMVESLRKGIPFAVGLAISEQESGFRSRAVSHTGCCYGLKQIHLRVWNKEMGVTLSQLYDPQENIRISYEILDRYRQADGSLYTAIRRYYGSTVPEENVAYAASVLRRSERIAAFINS